MIILYDMTRLVSRRNANTPTGIDRVDFRYATYFNNEEYEVYFILNEGGRFFLLDNKLVSLLLKSFTNRWINRKDDNFLSIPLQRYINTFFSYVRKKLQIQNKTLLQNNIEIQYKDTIKKFVYANPNKILKGKIKWINKFPKILKMLLLFILGNIYYLYKIVKVKFKKRLIQNMDEELYLDEKLMNLLRINHSKEILYFNTSHHGIDNINGYTDLIALGVKKMFFYIHDLIPIRFPEYVREGDDQKHLKRIETIISFSETIILTNSNASKEDIAKFIKESNTIHNPDIHVLNIGIEEHFLTNNNSYQKNSFNNYKPYFLYVSTIEPRKNHLLLLNLWRDMLMRYKEKDIPKLILVGKRGWENQCITAMLDRCNLIKKHVIELTDLSDDELIELNKNAQALLFPSYIEGWGMPLVESLSLGTPVICNNIAVFKEAGQDIPLYLDVLDGKNWEETIMDYSKDNSNKRIQQIKDINKFNKPTWEEHFIKLEKLL